MPQNIHSHTLNIICIYMAICFTCAYRHICTEMHINISLYYVHLLNVPLSHRFYLIWKALRKNDSVIWLLPALEYRKPLKSNLKSFAVIPLMEKSLGINFRDNSVAGFTMLLANPETMQVPRCISPHPRLTKKSLAVRKGVKYLRG